MRSQQNESGSQLQRWVLNGQRELDAPHGAPAANTALLLARRGSGTQVTGLVSSFPEERT